ncbi:MAG: heparinase II/III family protein [Acidobacteriota bacterium]|nr:heparinase II/III family protein [Acidobacteriota bacterium]
MRGRSFNELRVRGAQAVAALAERRGWSSQSRLPTDEAFLKSIDAAQLGQFPISAEGLLAHFRARALPRFFAGFARPQATVDELRRRWPESEKRVVASARRVVEGKFDLLGLHDLSFGDPVDWHLEPLAGKRAPLVHWSRIDYLNVDVTGDKKITWELNRQQYLMTLGRAYLYTGDELYAQTFARHVADWIEHNPPKIGINWASSLEVSFRAMAWLWALYFFRDSPHLRPALFLNILKVLFLHGRHLETYLSTYFSPNTHLTGEALGLFYLGTVLPELKCAARWRNTGERILMNALDWHVRPDGVYFEQSSYYHRYTTDFYTHLYILARANSSSAAQSGGSEVGSEAKSEVESERRLSGKLTALLDHLMYITRPDGTTPFFGDDDGGRLVMLDERPANDFRAALSTGAALFARPDYKHVAGEAAEETLWLLGTEGMRDFDFIEAHSPAQTSRAFPDGGYYVMRDGWESSANYMLIDCGPHGTLNCGHAHADMLAFELAARGRTMLIDPGTYTYTGASEVRDYFRTSAAHNTLTIDGESSSAPGGTFTWRHVARATPRTWVASRRFDFFEGAHDGYSRLASPATHTRSVLFLKNDYWMVRDRVASAGTHRYDLHFHFAPDAKLETITQPETEAQHDGALPVRELGSGDAPGMELFAFGAGGAWQHGDGWVSGCYRERVAAPVYSYSVEATGATEFVTFLVPQRAAGNDANTRVRQIEAVNGRAFEMGEGARRDVLVLGGSGDNGGAGGELMVETPRIKSDFAWTWARLTDDAPRAEVLCEFVLIDGRTFRFDNREVITTTRRVGHVVVRFTKGEVHIDIDAGESFSVDARGRRRVVINSEPITTSGEALIHFVDGRYRANQIISQHFIAEDARERGEMKTTSSIR